MSKKSDRALTLVAVLVTLGSWSVLLHYFSPIEMVEMIGVKNGYVVMFAVSLLGGMSSFGGAAYVATAITLAIGGLNPFFLAASATMGTIVGDSVFFIISHHSKDYINNTKLGLKVHNFGLWLSTKPKAILALFIYIYTAFTPLPNDLLTITLGITRQPYFLVISALALGNFTFVYLLAKFGSVLPF